MENQIESSWKTHLQNEFKQPYFAEIRTKYHNALKQNIILPPRELLFNAFNLTPFESVKVVILGQDPYYKIKQGISQAMGLSFSVPNGIKPPPSLQNIFKEIERDLGINMPTQSGNLSVWAKQGVLLLNTILSVELNKPLSHKDFGWEIFTDKVIKILSNKHDKLVFMLWGNYAQSKKCLIDSNKHFILETTHPSPLAQKYKKFIGCGHFSKCNEILRQNGIKPINWKL